MGAQVPSAGTWPGPVVPYEIDPGLTSPDRVIQAIRDHWENFTNLRFVQHSEQKGYLLFRHGQDCQSALGFDAEERVVTLKPGCSVATIVHEIGHAMGLLHEHQRSDRDEFVAVHEANIKPGKESNFVLQEDSVNLTDYDPRSIMHYDGTTFSVDSKPTLEPLDPTVTLDGSTTFTPADVRGIAELYPHVGVVRRSDSGTDALGAAQEIAVAARPSNSQVVTAVQSGQGTLLLILWRIGSTGSVQRIADSANPAGTAGAATDIAIARGGERYVTACRSGAGNLKLISWSVDGDQLIRDAPAPTDDSAGEADLIRLLALSNTLFITACRAGNGNLLLITWRLEADGTFSRLNGSGVRAGDVAEISFVKVPKPGSGYRVATTVRTPAGQALVIVWDVSGEGQVHRRGSSGLLGAGDLIETAVHPASGLLVMSCRTTAGTLRLTTLAISPAGAAVRRRYDSADQAGRVQANALTCTPSGMVSAVRGGDRNLLLIKWEIAVDGRITRRGDSSDQAGRPGLVRAVGSTGRPDAPVVTCVQDAAGRLMLITWDDQPEHGEIP